MNEPMKSLVAAIAKTLAAHNLTRAVVRYAGDGDEGGVDGFDYYADGEEPLDQMLLPTMEVQPEDGTEATPIADALTTLLDDVHGSVDLDWYEDGEGGLGELHVGADGSLRLDHQVRVTTYEKQTHHFH